MSSGGLHFKKSVNFCVAMHALQYNSIDIWEDCILHPEVNRESSKQAEICL
jgi:hypothetical protein